MRADENMDYHLARLLILISHFGGPGSKGIDGITKLAKLDFLLRYPSFTDRLLPSRNASWPLGCEPNDNEREAVESRSIRYKYGPWDNRYYPLLGRLVGYGLAESFRGRSGVVVRLTEPGAQLARQLGQSEEWQVVDGRSEMLSSRFNLQGNRLRKMIYEALPEVIETPS
ncbi:hypothetical protein AB0O57_07865 [Streptomyces sp. NPDC091201]|uniref:hypothetical protein n=1 Tax=Streptomyces sp. NPDC091201 TaxID=3155190 RepID=UPI0034151716